MAMKDLGLMAAGIAVFGLVVFGSVAAGAERSQGSTTRNGVSQPPLPDGIQIERNRLEAPNGR